MHNFAITPGLLMDGEVAYRREQLAADLSGARRGLGWWRTRRRRPATTVAELALAA